MIKTSNVDYHPRSRKITKKTSGKSKLPKAKRWEAHKDKWANAELQQRKGTKWFVSYDTFTNRGKVKTKQAFLGVWATSEPAAKALVEWLEVHHQSVIKCELVNR